MSWDYRVVVTERSYKNLTALHSDIRMVWYDDDGNIEGWRDRPSVLTSYSVKRDGVQEVNEDVLKVKLTLMNEALSKTYLREIEEGGELKLVEFEQT